MLSYGQAGMAAAAAGGRILMLFETIYTTDEMRGGGRGAGFGFVFFLFPQGCFFFIFFAAATACVCFVLMDPSI